MFRRAEPFNQVNLKNMNKNITTVVIVIALLLLAVVGYAVWMAYNPTGVVVPNENTNTNTNNGEPVSQPTAPTVQTDSVAAPYISTVVVKGSVNPNGAATTYWFEYGKTSALGTKTSKYSIGSGFVKIYTPAYITGLEANTTYYFRLSANNSLGTVNAQTYSFTTNNTPNPKGNAPTTTTVDVNDITRTTANFHGRVNPNGSETTFWFEYGKTANLGSVTAFQSAGSQDSASPVSVSVSNLQPLTKYYFRLNAQNQFGTINGQILNFTTNGPSQATVPTVTTDKTTAITDSSAKLNATINANGATTTYWFEYSDDSLLSNVLVSTTPQQSIGDGTSSVSVSANLNNLDNDKKYYIRAVAKNQYGTVRGDIDSFTSKK